MIMTDETEKDLTTREGLRRRYGDQDTIWVKFEYVNGYGSKDPRFIQIVYVNDQEKLSPLFNGEEYDFQEGKVKQVYPPFKAIVVHVETNIHPDVLSELGL